MPDDLADVYRSTYPALVRFLYRKVWDAERAEDLAQEAFSRALAHRPENPRAGSLSWRPTWLVTKRAERPGNGVI